MTPATLTALALDLLALAALVACAVLRGAYWSAQAKLQATHVGDLGRLLHLSRRALACADWSGRLMVGAAAAGAAAFVLSVPW